MRLFSIFSLSLLGFSLACVHSRAVEPQIQDIGNRNLSCDDQTTFHYAKLDFNKQGSRVNLKVSSRTALNLAEGLGLRIPRNVYFDEIELEGDVPSNTLTSTCRAAIENSSIVACALGNVTAKFTEAVSGRQVVVRNVQLGLESALVHTQKIEALNTISKSDSLVFDLRLMRNAGRTDQKNAEARLHFIPTECQ